MKGLAVGAENMQAAESRIRDADMAAEIVEFTKNSDSPSVFHSDAGSGEPETSDPCCNCWAKGTILSKSCERTTDAAFSVL